MGDVARDLWPDVYARVRAMLDVTSRGRPGLDRSFYAESSVGEPDTTWLDDDDLIASLMRPEVIYVVYSYAIPIGWTDGKHWTIHYATDSKTTRGHVNHLRRALSVERDQTLHLPGPLSFPNTRQVARRIFRDAYPALARQGWRVNLTGEYRSGSDLYTVWSWDEKQLSTYRTVPTITEEWKGA